MSIWWPIREQIKALRTGLTTSVQLVEKHLEQIDALNCKYNALVTLCADEALAKARWVDKEKIALPLAGIVMSIKDSLDTAGVATSGGTMGRVGMIPKHDATVVRRLREQGAILIGKSNTPELTLNFETNNIPFGATSNPYDIQRTPGGSSGGAAVAVCTGMSTFDIGTDYGGSIRIPSHWTGTAGLKPTHGSISRTGHILDYTVGLTESFQTVGPIARSVDDLNLLLPIIAGPDGIDPYIVSRPPFKQSSHKLDLSKLRVGFNIASLPGLNCTPSAAICTAVNDSTAALTSVVRSIEEIALPRCLVDTQSIWRGIALADGGQCFRDVLAAAGTPRAAASEHMAWCLDQKISPSSPTEIADLLRKLSDYRCAMNHIFDDIDVLIWPVHAEVAPFHGFSRDNMDHFTYTYALNLSGHPSVVVRTGTDPENLLPVGVQVITRHWREDLALKVARYLEYQLGGWKPPPDCPSSSVSSSSAPR